MKDSTSFQAYNSFFGQNENNPSPSPSLFSFTDLKLGPTQNNQIVGPVTERFLTSINKNPVNIAPNPIYRTQNDWQLVIIIFCFFVISYIRIVRKTFFKTLTQAIYSRPIFRQMIRDGILFSFSTRIPVLMVMILSFSIFLYHTVTLINPGTLPFNLSPFLFYLVSLAVIVVILFAKSFVVKVAGVIFKTKEITTEYLMNSYYYNLISAIMLLPILLFSVFNNSLAFTYIGLIIIGLFFLIRLMKGISISFDMRKYSVYQNFFYLCTLEILPLVIIIKAILR